MMIYSHRAIQILWVVFGVVILAFLIYGLQGCPQLH